MGVASDPTKPLIGRGLTTEDRGYSEKAIKTAEKRLAPLPPELSAFFRRVTPVSECPEEWISVGFQPLNDPDLTWLDNPRLRKKKLWFARRMKGGVGLMVGQPLVYW